MLTLNGLATLTNLNLRTEKVGKEKTRPAADIKLTADIPNTMLEDIEPGLLRSLYRGEKEKGHQADLVADPGVLTTPRYPRAKPIQFTEEWPGYFLTIQAGEFDLQELELDKVTLKGITITPKNGGTVELGFSLGCHPDPATVAGLYQLMSRDITVGLQPPTLATLTELRAEAKAGATKASGNGEQHAANEPPADGPIPDAAAGRAFPDALDGRRARSKAATAAAAH